MTQTPLSDAAKLRVTLDYNCVVDLEERRPAAAHVSALAALAQTQALRMQIPAAAGSERRPDGTYAQNISRFLERVDALNLGAEILYPLMRVGIGFIGYSVLSGPQLEFLEEQIHRILFPSLPNRLDDYCQILGVPDDDPAAYRRWLNAKCDVDAMWCHVHSGGDIFVTSDDNFRKRSKIVQLQALGAGQILTPADAVTEAARRLKLDVGS